MLSRPPFRTPSHTNSQTSRVGTPALLSKPHPHIRPNLYQPHTRQSAQPISRNIRSPFRQQVVQPTLSCPSCWLPVFPPASRRPRPLVHPPFRMSADRAARHPLPPVAFYSHPPKFYAGIPTRPPASAVHLEILSLIDQNMRKPTRLILKHRNCVPDLLSETSRIPSKRFCRRGTV